jgi:uncharacterized membrane protein
VSGADRCAAPDYEVREVETAGFLASEFHLEPESLGLEAVAGLQLLEVTCEGTQWPALGGRLLQIAGERGLAPWDGVFFELEKRPEVVQAAFRAVGNEPGWVLEIVPEKWIRFSYDYGEREAYTPVPEPVRDGAAGATVYHAITEASDLRVVIERNACLDTMSGREFEAKVTVTLDGTTYRGCGAQPTSRNPTPARSRISPTPGDS